MISFINGRLSIAARLSLIAACLSVPIVLLLVLFANQVWKEISFAQKEVAGSTYLAQVWPAFTAAASGGDAPTGQADASVQDARFASGDASRAFAGASGAERTRAGVALIAAISDGSNLTLDPDLDSFYAVDAATVEMPRLLAAAADVSHAAAAVAGATGKPEDLAVARDACVALA